MSEVVGFSSDLKASRAMRAMVSEVDLVIWRSASGTLSAWENRCPHRGMRLSHGFVRGESLACIYHGWQFGSKGKCQYIPALPNVTPSDALTPASYSVVEQDQLIWVSVSGQAKPFPIAQDMTAVRSLTFACSTVDALKAFSTTPLPITLETPNALIDVNHELSLLTVSFTEHSTEITVVVQSLPDSRSAVHVMANSRWTVEQKITLSRWCEQVRRQAEAACTPVN